MRSKGSTIEKISRLAETDPRHAAVLESLRVVSRHMAQMAHAMAARMGIHPTDLFAIMDVVDFRERHGRSPTIGELGEVTGLSSAAATTLVDRLVNAGYVERIRDTKDRRRVYLQLTPRHLDAAAPMLRVYLERLTAALDRFDDHELDAAARVLEASRVAMEHSAGTGVEPHHESEGGAGRPSAGSAAQPGGDVNAGGGVNADDAATTAGS